MAKAPKKTDNTTPIEPETGMWLEDAPSDKPSIEAAEGLNPRKSQLDEIFANRQKQIEKESNFGAELTAASEETPQNPEPPVEAPPSDGQPPEVVAPTTIPAEDQPTVVAQDQIEQPEGEPLYTLRVDGIDLKLTKDQLIERAQKGIGAEKKFEEASRIRREAEQVLYHAQPSQPQAPAQQNSAPQGHPQKPIELDDSTAEDFLNKLNFGSKDEQKAALRNLVSKVATQTPPQAMPDIGQIVNMATHNAVNAMQSQQQMANLGAEFNDVFNDYPLTMAAGALTNQLVQKYQQAGVNKTLYDVSREALATVRERYVRKADDSALEQPTNSAPSSPQVVQMDNKIAAKRAAPKPVVAANVKASTEPTAPKAKSGQGKSDTVSWMRQGRGQPIYS